MTLAAPYKLVIKVITPNVVIEGEFFDIIYEIKNDSDTLFPGGNLRVYMSWPEISASYLVHHDLGIKEIKPKESQRITTKDKPSASGMTTFLTTTPSFQAFDGNLTRLYLEDGRQLDPMQVFGAVRAKSRKEIIQEELTNALKESIKSQNRLTLVGTLLTIVAVAIAFLQLLMMIS